jgi:hypothetical protein
MNICLPCTQIWLSHQYTYTYILETSHDHEYLPPSGGNDESPSQADQRLAEEESLVAALRNTFMPRLGDRDCSVLASLLKDMWPAVTLPMRFGGKTERWVAIMIRGDV